MGFKFTENRLEEMLAGTPACLPASGCGTLVGSSLSSTAVRCYKHLAAFVFGTKTASTAGSPIMIAGLSLIVKVCNRTQDRFATRCIGRRRPDGSDATGLDRCQMRWS